MNSKRGQNNTDSCRDLNGRRLSTIKEAKKLAEYVASAPEREAAKRDEAKARLAKLQEEIQRIDGGNTSGSDKVTSSSANASTSKAGVKRRLDDQKYVEESREMVDNVKNAVAAGEYSLCLLSAFSRTDSLFRLHSNDEETQAGQDILSCSCSTCYDIRPGFCYHSNLGDYHSTGCKRDRRAIISSIC